MKYAFPLQLRFRVSRQSHLAMIDGDVLSRSKADLAKSSSAGFVSSNDVLMAAISEMFTSSLVIMHMNMRGRIQNALPNCGGNFERNVVFPRKLAAASARGPSFMRDVIVKKGYFYESNEVPFWPFLLNSVGIVTNWATITEFFHPPGTEVLAHAPLSSFVLAVPRDLCVIFKPAPGAALALSHNFFVGSPLFQARARRSSHWRFLVRPICRPAADASQKAGIPWTTLAGCCAGMLLGLLLASRCRRD